jgi:hypothetical protein
MDKLFLYSTAIATNRVMSLKTLRLTILKEPVNKQLYPECVDKIHVGIYWCRRVL